MSGICGIVAAHGPSPGRTDIETLVEPLTRRGPDGTHVWRAGRAALGHSLLATTPQSLFETLPLTDPESGCTITADVRLDNRAELIAALGLGDAGHEPGDGNLILQAYLRWGHDSLRHLLGDFAFAIWDERSATLFCARDQMGMRQLTYLHRPGRDFIFATEPYAIAGFIGPELPINPLRMADFLGNMEAVDLVSTCFEGVLRLPPAHVLVLAGDRLSVTRYWQLEASPPLLLPSDEAYAQAFRELFTKAVECRLVSVRPVGAMLSGGLDSNSVAAVAAGLEKDAGRGPLQTFSAIGPDPAECIETRSILTALSHGDYAATTVSAADVGRDKALLRATLDSAEPFDGVMVIIRAVYAAARAAGVNVVLDGVNGDIALVSQFHIANLLRRGKVAQAIANAREEQRSLGYAPAWRLLLAACWQAFAPAFMREIRFRLARRASNRAFLSRLAEAAPFVDPDAALARRKEMQRRDSRLDRNDRDANVRAVTHPNVVLGRERYDRVAAAFAIEPRDPFMDVRLIRFCLSLPAEQLQRHGWSKWILRQAMAGTLPRNVAWRRGKEHLGPSFIQGLAMSVRPRAQLDAHPTRPAPGDPIPFQLVDNLFLSHWITCMKRRKPICHQPNPRSESS